MPASFEALIALPSSPVETLPAGVNVTNVRFLRWA